MGSSKIEITIVADDLAGPGLRPEHGFALWIEAAGKRILFDTGQGDALLPNTAALGIDLSTADALVLSHGHYDHTGGVAAVLALAPKADVYCHPSVVRERYSITNGTARQVGMPTQSRAALESLASSKLHLVCDRRAISPGIGVTGTIPRVTDYEDTGGPFFLDQGGVTPDPIDDDMALWLDTPQGPVVCTGCSHAGLVNTIRFSLRKTGTDTIRAVIGGFHLVNASAQRLRMTSEEVKGFQPSVVAPCHCSGQDATAALVSTLGGIVRPGSSGVRFLFEQEHE